jgi:hypothetical protein
MTAQASYVNSRYGLARELDRRHPTSADGSGCSVAEHALDPGITEKKEG